MIPFPLGRKKKQTSVSLNSIYAQLFNKPPGFCLFKKTTTQRESVQSIYPESCRKLGSKTDYNLPNEYSF